MPLNAITVTTSDVDRGLRDIIRELEREEPKHVDTGVLAKEGSELVKIAAANEFGATIRHPGGTAFGFKTRRDAQDGKVRFLKKGQGFLVLGTTKPHTIVIPARSFIRSTIDNHQEEIMDFAESLARRIADGQMDKKDALSAIGEKIKSLIQLRIIELRDPPNAPSTLRQKRPKTNPLVNTGRLGQSIAWQIG